MTSAQRTVLFFGSVSAAIVGVQMRNAALLTELAQQSGSLKLRLTATAASVQTEEVFGAVSTSEPLVLEPTTAMEGAASSYREDNVDKLFPIRAQQSLFLPLMLELAQDPAADGIPSESGSEADAELDSQVASRPATSGGGGARAIAKARGKPTEGHGVYATTLSISADVTRGSNRAVLVRTRRVMIPSANRHAARDTCTVVRVSISAKLLTRSATSPSFAAAEVEKDVADADAAISVYVLLRIASLSERAAAAEDAVDDLRQFLGLAPPIPRLSLAYTRRVRVPYGFMPLNELYRHYRLFYGRYYGKTLKPSAEITRILTEGSNDGRIGGIDGVSRAAQVDSATASSSSTSSSYPYRWNALSEVRLDRVLLGEEGFAPLLLTLAHCPNLCTLVADRNELGDITCARLCALLYRFRYLRSLSLAHNAIYEGGADQLLRLARRNHRIHMIDIKGNWCSEAVRSRIEAATAASQRAIARDPLNVFSSQYDYLVSPASIPATSLKLALSVWAMLTAASVGDIDVWVRNTTTRDMDMYLDEAIAPRRELNRQAARAPLSIVPPAARAPLLSEVMRTVYAGICTAAPDPLVRSCFVDLEEARQKRKDALQSRLDGARFTDAATDGSNEGDGGDDSDDREDDNAKSLDSLEEANRRGKDRAADTREPGPMVAGNADDIGDIPNELAEVLGLGHAVTTIDGNGRREHCVDVAQLLCEAEDDIYNASFLKIVVTTMRAIASGSPWEEVSAVLRGIGALHRSLGLRVEDYWLATHVFIKGLSVCLGSDEFTSDRLAAFVITLALGIRTASTTAEGKLLTL